MMNIVWTAMILVSLIYGTATGNIRSVTSAMLSGAADGVTLVLSLTGAMCLWSGILRIAEASGVTDWLSRRFRPLLRFLFRELPADSPAAKAISMNLAANLLGMGNAATPMGIAAMKELQKRNPTPDTATTEMIRFVVLNTASLQLIPSTIAVIRSNYGCDAPFDILFPILISSLSAATAALTVAYLFHSKDAMTQRRACIRASRTALQGRS